MGTTISNLKPKETPIQKKQNFRKLFTTVKLDNLLVPEDFSDETSSDFNIVIFLILYKECVNL